MVALVAAVVLAAALVYTSFSEATQAETPRQVLALAAGSIQMTGKVVAGTIRHDRPDARFRLRDLNGSASRAGRLPGARPRSVRARARGDNHGRAAGAGRSSASAARSSPSARRSIRACPRGRRSEHGRAWALMAAIGSAALLIALLTAVYVAGSAIYGARTGRREFVVSARRAMYALAACSSSRRSCSRSPTCAPTSRSSSSPRTPRPTRRPSTS